MVTDGKKIFEERRKKDRRIEEKNVASDRREKSDRRVKDINGPKRKRKLNRLDENKE